MRRLALLGALALSGCFLRYVAPALCMAGDGIGVPPSPDAGWNAERQAAYSVCRANALGHFDGGTEECR